MGLYGALVVRRPGTPARSTTGPTRRSTPSTSTSSCSPRSTPTCTWPSSAAEPIDWNGYNARYYMINGRSMPDTLAPNNASWLPNQPYGALVHIKPVRRGHQPAAGGDPLPQRRDGQLPVPPARQRRARGQQGRPCPRRARPARTCPYLKYDLDVQPGQTVDALMDWRDVEHWNAADQPDPDPDPRHHRPAPRGHRHLVQREPLPRHEERAPHDDHGEQRVRRVLPHRPQPRARSRPPTTERPSEA